VLVQGGSIPHIAKLTPEELDIGADRFEEGALEQLSAAIPVSYNERRRFHCWLIYTNDHPIFVINLTHSAFIS
jgi:hypothetical protein